MNRKQVGKKLRLHLVKREERVGEFAKRMGTSSPYISNVLNGDSPPNGAILNELGLIKVKHESTYIKG